MKFSFRLFRPVPLLIAAALADQKPSSKEITVWTIDASKVYHCPGSRWYKTGKGKEMGECSAIRGTYKPAFGRGCGSTCRAK